MQTSSHEANSESRFWTLFVLIALYGALGSLARSDMRDRLERIEKRWDAQKQEAPDAR